MKYLLFSFFCIAVISSACKQEALRPIETIFLVRHAEKESDGSSDPGLTAEGHARSEKLSSMLSNVGISKIYSSNYNRTRLTAEPLANRLSLQTIIYDPKTQDSLVKQINEHSDPVILIVGHSNSIPQLCNLILGREEYKALDESQYDHIFVINKCGSSLSSYILKY